MSIVLVLYIYLGSYNRLLADDFCSIYYAERLGFFRSIWYWYKTWHGGFSASALDWLLSFLTPGILPFTVFIFLVGWIAVATAAMRKFFSFKKLKSFNLFVSLLLGLLLVFTTLVITPDISQSLIWWGGARAYLPPLIVATFYVLMYSVFTNSIWLPWQVLVWCFGSFLVIFFCGGFAETYTPVQLVLFSGTILWGWLKGEFASKKLSYLFLLSGAIGAFLSLVVMVSAPGNASRQEFFPPPSDVLTILNISMQAYLKFLLSILASLDSSTAVLGAMFAAVWLGVISNHGKEVVTDPPSLPLQSLMILVVGFVLAFGCFPPSVFGTSEAPHPRNLIIPIYFLVSSIIGFGCSFGHWLALRWLNPKNTPFFLFIVAFVFIAFSATQETSVILKALPKYVRFSEKWDNVDLEIKNAKKDGHNEVFIPAMVNWAGLEYPTDNPNYWPNICYSKYYDVPILAPALGN